jgi:predicted TIM-barrel fold metal-dependent hydrolase
MSREIIDFHIHPWLDAVNNYCFFKDLCSMTPEEGRRRLELTGITKACGSVIGNVTGWDDIVRLNDTALKVRENWGDFYIPGFHIHPDHVEQSISEIHRMAAEGVRLVGELVPYIHGWDMGHPGLVPILEAAAEHHMILSFHSTDVTDEMIEPLLERFPQMPFVAAHPVDKEKMRLHIGRMQRHENYYLDLSGAGIGRMSLLPWTIKQVGYDRILFGTDFPACPPEIYVAAVTLDPMLTEAETQAILWDNAAGLMKQVL